MSTRKRLGQVEADVDALRRALRLTDFKVDRLAAAVKRLEGGQRKAGRVPDFIAAALASGISFTSLVIERGDLDVDHRHSPDDCLDRLLPDVGPFEIVEQSRRIGQQLSESLIASLHAKLAGIDGEIAGDVDGHIDSSTQGRPESVTLHITVEVPARGGGDSRPCACGGAK